MGPPKNGVDTEALCHSISDLRRKPHLMDTGEIKQSYFDIPNMIKAAQSTWIEPSLSLRYNLLFVIFYDKK